MASHILAKDILAKIIIEKIPFALVLKTVFKQADLEKEDRSITSALVGCALRHYLVAERLIKDTYPSIDNSGLMAVLVALSNALFIKKIDQNECNSYAQSFIKEDETKINDFITPFVEGKKLVPEDIEVGSFEFLSYRYNTPVSIIKMWNKQFGNVTTSRILKANSKPAPIVVRINNNLINDEDFFSQYPDFEKTELSGVALFNGEGRLKNHPALDKKHAALCPAAYKEMLDEVDADVLRGIAVYSEYPNEIVTELVSRFNNLNGVEIIAGSYSAFVSIKNALNKASVSGVNVYDAGASSIITCLSKPVHTFIVLPDSSKLNMLEVLPDYFLHFDTDQLDELISGQTKALKEAALQVEEGGYLLYLVNTISKKENSGVISTFLKDHPDFTLLKDKLYFPYKKFGGSYFFAVLKKESKND